MAKQPRSVEVHETEDHRGWAIIVSGRQAVVVPNEQAAQEIAEELAGWLQRSRRTELTDH
jgi:hypothetical protein